MGEKPKRINLLTDTGFKVAFGKENQSEEILRFFLNELFKGEEGFSEIKEVRFINTERVRETEDMRSVIHDIMCTTSDGRRFLVEMQNVSQPYFLNRAFYYICKGISDQGTREAGDIWKYEYEPVYGIFLCNFDIKGFDPELVVHGRVLDVKSHKPIGDFLRLAFIQIPKTPKRAEECKTKIEKLIYIVKNMVELENNPFAAEMAEVYGRIEKVSRYAALTPEEKIKYDADLKWYLDTNAFIQTTIEEGMEIGKKEGMKEGKKEGIIEERKRLVKNLRDSGMKDEDISVATKIPLEEIREY